MKLRTLIATGSLALAMGVAGYTSGAVAQNATTGQKGSINDISGSTGAPQTMGNAGTNAPMAAKPMAKKTTMKKKKMKHSM